MAVTKSASVDYWPKHIFPERSPRLRLTRRILRGIGNIALKHIVARTTIIGQEQNVPRTGPAIVVFNHTAFVDPILIACGITVRGIVPLGKKELADNPLIGWTFWAWGAIPVKRGQVDRAALKRAIEVIDSEEMLLIAPEGHRQKNGMHNPKEGVIMLAAHTGAAIVPIGISGAKNFTRNLLRLRRTPITAVVGKPIRVKEDVTRKQYKQAADEIMYQIAPLVDESLRGDYADLSKATMDTIEFV